MTNKMQAAYVTDNNKAAKLFREDFYATADMLEIGIHQILAETPDATISIIMLKRKMHELLFDFGMSAFKGKKASQKAKQICKEMLPDFYQEMKAVEEPKATAEKKTTAPKQEKGKTTPKDTSKKSATTKDSTKEKGKTAEVPAKKSAMAPDFQEETGSKAA